MDHAKQTRLALLGKRKPMSENAKALIAIAVLFVAYAFVGTMEFNDIEAQKVSYVSA